MSAPSPRRWYQLRIASCVVMMLVSGIVLYFNTMQAKHIIFDQSDSEEAPLQRLVIDLKPEDYRDATPSYRRRLFGWPIPIFEVVELVKSDGKQWVPQESGRLGLFSHHRRSSLDLPFGILLDLLAALAFILTAGFATEWLIRRREARKP